MHKKCHVMCLQKCFCTLFVGNSVFLYSLTLRLALFDEIQHANYIPCDTVQLDLLLYFQVNVAFLCHWVPCYWA